MAELKTRRRSRIKEYLSYDKVDLSPECFPALVWEKRNFVPNPLSFPAEQDESFSYYSAPLVHKTLNSQGRLTTDAKFEVEGPILTSIGGINLVKRGNKLKATCNVVHDLSDIEIKKYCGIPIDASRFAELPERSASVFNPEELSPSRGGEFKSLSSDSSTEGKDSVGFLTQLYLRCVLYAFEERRKLNCYSAKNLNMFEGICVSPLKWELDNCGNPIPDRGAFKRYSIFVQGDLTKPNHKKAPFAIPTKITATNKSGQIVLPWSRLQNVELRFRPVIQFTHLDCMDKKFILRCQIVSAIVYGFTLISVLCKQEAQLARAREDEELLEDLQCDLEDSLSFNPEGGEMQVFGGEKINVVEENLAQQREPSLVAREEVEQEDIVIRGKVTPQKAKLGKRPIIQSRGVVEDDALE